MVATGKTCAAVLAAFALAGCIPSGNPFSNPFGSSQPRVAVQPQQPPVQPPLPPPVASGNKPTVQINVSPQRVQDTIIARARSRGTNVLGANATGVTLEVPLRQSSQVVEQQCGPHQDGRTLRVYLATAPDGPGTIVTEDRYVIDGGATTCQLQLTDSDIQEANRSLGDLKAQAERPRTARASTDAPAMPPLRQ
ncbi:MAG: hypothetical protein ACRCUE_06490 [Bosea sp. (in: a-proteobacteria)]